MGLEPMTFSLWDWRANHLLLLRIINKQETWKFNTFRISVNKYIAVSFLNVNDPGGIWTHDRTLRRRMLYPAELPGLELNIKGDL